MCAKPFRAAAFASLLAPLVALAAPTQLTASVGANSFGASVSDDGNRVAFYSASNLTGANADGSFEIYLYDRPSNSLTQVSNFAGGALAGGNQVPMLSGDGQRLSYQHFVNSGGVATFQSVFYDAATKATVVVTPPAGFGETNELSRDGKTIAIATGNTGLRLYDVGTGTLGPVIAGNTFHTAMSRDGSKLALELFGRIELHDLKNGTTLAITPPNAGFNLRPDLSDDGTKLAFTSTYDPLGSNADHNAEVFLYDVVTNTVRQLTHTTGGANSNSQVSLSADGTRIAFASTADPLGTNADGNQEVFVYDLPSDVLTQVTNTSGDFSVDPSLSGDGLSLAYTSSADLSGANPNHIPQIFLQSLAPRNAVPEPSTPLLLLAAGLAAGAWRRRGRLMPTRVEAS
jgi:Tol biopolymer transport system component